MAPTRQRFGPLSRPPSPGKDPAIEQLAGGALGAGTPDLAVSGDLKLHLGRARIADAPSGSLDDGRRHPAGRPNVLVAKGAARDVPITTIFRGVAPFLLAIFVGLLLIIMVSQIALLISNSMFGS